MNPLGQTHNASETTAPDMSVTLAGIPLASPLVLLSGCVAFAEDLIALEGFDFDAVGAICLKGTTLHPRPGNAPNRVAETPAGMLNAIGLQNPGARTVVEEILPRLQQHQLPCRLIANIAGSTVEEYGEVARIFDDSPVDGIEINISCPNVKEGGVAFGSDAAIAARVVETVRDATSKPLITKLSPNVTDIQEVARATIESGTDALSVINTLMGMAVDIRSRKPVLGNIQGGLSGPAIKPVALLKTWQVHQVAAPHAIPIIGQGGVASGEDAVAFMLVGATAVGMCTTLFRNPWAPAEVLTEMRRYAESNTTERISDLIGGLITEESPTKRSECGT
ncbi:MAG: dihydroorotate dehydrogenase [Magnetococcales bacterium]|nr:dihydroorotate dehydrogenase [Magnetococcales bacterium]